MAIRVSLALSLVCGVIAQTNADEFHAIEAVTVSTEASDLWTGQNLIQGPGVGFAAEEPHDKLVGGPGGNWVTADDAGFPSDYIEQVGKPVIALDLGADVALGEISVWGYSNSNANGVSEYSLKFATDADGPSGFGNSIAYNPTFTLNNDNENARQEAMFGEVVTARYVEFTTEDNFFVAPGDGSAGGVAGGDRVGLGEIAFSVVPEPSSILLLLTAFVGMLGLRRQK
ncbi:MAG: PEP-CTERM sorting domain-containing protein [Planctomycetaceae bacterium]|nr:PEP-CTERM sorting domain-containing protein [Planctomycetaceae bacterium]